MELFRKNCICFPQKFFLHKSSDTVHNPAVDNSIKLLLVPCLSCRSSMTAPVPWAATRSGCSPAQLYSCTPGLVVQTPTSMHSFNFISRAHYNYDSQTRKKPCKLNWQSSQTSVSAQAQAMLRPPTWTCRRCNTKASRSSCVLQHWRLQSSSPYSWLLPRLAYKYLTHPPAISSGLSYLKWLACLLNPYLLS